MSDEYLAGFFDGEGSIGIYSRGRTSGIQLRVQLTQFNCEETNLLFSDLKVRYGGSIQSSGMIKDRVLKWTVAGDKSIPFLIDILPYLRFKTDQVMFALDWYSKRKKWANRNSLGQVISLTNEQLQDNQTAIDTLKGLKKR